jgi:hypothetical protein
MKLANLYMPKPGKRLARSQKAFSELVLKQTRNGEELLEFVLKVFRDDQMPFRDRMIAMNWLADRAFGKAPQHVDVDVSVGGQEPQDQTGMDFSKLSTEELHKLQEMYKKAAPEQLAAPATVDVIEAEYEEVADAGSGSDPA